MRIAIKRKIIEHINTWFIVVNELFGQLPLRIFFFVILKERKNNL